MSASTAPFISIVVPVYNAETYLRECINSIANQSLREIEIICVNDCSTDGSLSILREFEAVDNRLKVVDGEVNRGLSAARNVGMSFATGQYLLFVDSDDYVDRELCRKAFNCAEANHADLVLYDYVPFWGKDASHLSRARDSQLSQADSTNRGYLLSLPAYAWAKLILSDLARSMKLRFPEGFLYEDLPVHWALVTTSSRIALLPERLYFYRQRSGSIGGKRDWRLADRILVYDQIKEYLMGKSLYRDYCDVFLEQKLGTFYGVYDAIDKPFKRDVMAMIQQRMTDEHWRFVADGRLPRPVRDFFLSLQGKTTARFRRSIWLLVRRCYRLLRPVAERHRS